MTDRALPFHRRWPALQVFVLDAARLVYLPIAKNACTSLKRLCVELSDLPEAEKAEILTEVHGQTDSRNTGLQLKDRSEAAARAAIASEGWMRFAVIRDPHDRLVSAYVEKFVIRRERKRITTGAAVAAIQGAASAAAADLDTGVRFCDFLDFVLSQPPEALDPHWRRQVDSFEAVDCTHLYALENLGLLADDLSAHLRQPIEIGAANRQRVRPVRHVPGAAGMWPGEFESPGDLHPDSFYDTESRARVAAHFAADVTLYRAVLRENAARLAARQRAQTGAGAPRTWRKRLSLNGIRRLVSG